MAVPKITETRHRDGRQDRTHKDYTSNPIPTSFYPCYSSVGYDTRLLERKLHLKNQCCVTPFAVELIEQQQAAPPVYQAPIKKH